MLGVDGMQLALVVDHESGVKRPKTVAEVRNEYNASQAKDAQTKARLE